MENKNGNKTYNLYVDCNNCGRKKDAPLDVPVGVPWDKYLNDIEYECEKCGCIGHMMRC